MYQAYPRYPSVNYNQFLPQQSSPQTTTNLVWVQGENAAKSYPVAAGQSMLLIDSESDTMYIKSTDQSGMPLPLRVFDFKERQNERTEHSNTVVTNNTDYILRSEFDAFKHEIRDILKAQNSSVTNNTPKRTNKGE